MRRFYSIFGLFTLFSLITIQPALAVPTCTVTGTITDGANNPVANGVVTFNTLFTQVVSSNTINQTLVSTTTDSAGVLSPISLAQGVYVQITVNGGAPITAIVPFSTSVSFSALISNVVTNPATTEIDFQGQSSAPTCSSGDGVVYFDSTTNLLKVSNNCGTYQFIVNTNNVNDDTVPIANGTGWVSTSIPDCQDSGGQHLNYTASTNELSCGNTSSGGGGGGGNITGTGTLNTIAKFTGTNAIGDSSITDNATLVALTEPLDFAQQAAPSVSASGHSTVYMDSTSHTLKLSQNAGAYANVVTTGTVKSYWLSNTNGNNVSNTATNYFDVMGASTPTTSARYMSMPSQGVSGTLKNLGCLVGTNPGAGKSYTITLEKDGVATSLVCLITGATSSCNDNTHTTSVTGSDYFRYIVTPAGTPPAAGVRCTMEYDS